MFPKRILKDSLQFDAENLKFHIKITLKENPLYLKIITENILYSNEQIFTKTFIVKDSIPKILWQIYDEEKICRSQILQIYNN